MSHHLRAVRFGALGISLLVVMGVVPVASVGAAARQVVMNSPRTGGLTDLDWSVKTSVSIGAPEAQVILVGDQVVVSGGSKTTFLDKRTLEVLAVTEPAVIGAASTDGTTLFGGTSTGVARVNMSTHTYTTKNGLCGRARDVEVFAGKIYLSCDDVVIELQASNLTVLRQVSVGTWNGRVAVTADSIWVPTYFNGLKRVDRDTFTVEGSFTCGHGGYATGEAWKAYTDGKSVLCVGLHSVSRHALDGTSLSSVDTAQEQYGNYYATSDDAGAITTGTSGGMVQHISFTTGQIDWSHQLSGASSGTGGASGVATDGRVIFVYQNSSRQLTRFGVGNPSMPTDVRVAPSGSAVVVSWGTVSGASSYRVSVSPDGLSCESVELSCTVSGLTPGVRYSVRVVAVDGDVESDPSAPVSFVAGDPPSAPLSVEVVPGDGVAVVSWSAPLSEGDAPVSAYTVRSRPGGKSCSTDGAGRSCEVAGLSNGVPYVFAVVATSAVGDGVAGLSGEAVAFSWPGVPLDVKVFTLQGSAGVQVRWGAADANGSEIMGYVVGVSRDDGRTWVEKSFGAGVRSWVMPEFDGAARAGLVRVAAVNVAGQGAWSQSVLGVSRGSRAMRVSVVDGVGVPVIGGAITWVLRNAVGEVVARSSVTYGLTGDGVIEFPYAPAGRMQLTVTGALTDSGASVSGMFTAVLGFTDTVLRLPRAPVSRRMVRVLLPWSGGVLPVPGVSVSVDPAAAQFSDADCVEWFDGSLSVDDYCLEYAEPSVAGGLVFAKTVQGFRFSVPRVSTELVTDRDGRVKLVGFFTGQPRVTVDYDDDVIVQSQRVVLRNESTDVELDYMPWLEVAQDTLTATAGAAVPLVVTVQNAVGLLGRDVDVMSRAGLPRAGAGVAVTVLPPAGAPKGNCGSKLTATTNDQGRATVTVCATKSGEYRFATSGAAAVASVMLRVKGAAPLPPTAVTVRSLSVGTARVTWNPPAYTGGASITGYVIIATAKGKPTVTKQVAATARSVSLTDLANATTYAVSISATTSKGTSDKNTATVPVA